MGILCTWFFSYLYLRHYSHLRSLSTLNSSLSILLLLHSTSIAYLCLAASLAVSSKFLLRWNNRHIFNPSNIAIVVCLLLFDQTWAAPGQWGQTLWLLLLMAGLGLIFFVGLNIMASSLSFLLCYTLIIMLRAVWLNDPLMIPFHQLQNGALLIFCFFMLADPMTTPAHTVGRIAFGAIVALLSAILLYYFYLPNAFLYALALCSPLVILLNHTIKHPYFIWKAVQQE